MKNFGSRLCGVSLLVAISVAFTAWGGGGTAESVAETTNVAGTPSGTLRFARTTPPSQLDPHKSTSLVADWSYLVPIYDRLTQVAPGPTLTPAVAESWEFSEDQTEVIFHLRDDVVFHDGATLDATAVQRSIERALTLEDSTVKPVLSAIDSVEARDAQTVVFTVNRPSADLPYILAGPAGALISPDLVDEPDLATTDAGSGPYRLDELIPGDRVVYTAFEDWWGEGAPSLERLELIGMVDDNARFNALRSGQVEAMQVQTSQIADAQDLAEDDAFQYIVPPAAAWLALILNPSMPPLDDVRVRQALNYAIDREAISDALLGGLCEPTSQPFQDGYAGFNPDVVPYTYDPERARELLAEAGLADGFEMSVYVGTGLSPHTQIAVAVQDQLAEVGITLEIKQADVRQFVGEWMSGASHAVVLARTPDANPTLTLVNAFLLESRYPGPISEDFRAAVEATYVGGLDADEFDSQLMDASKIASEEAYDLFLCANPYTWLASSSVTGLDSMPGIDLGTTIEPQFLGLDTETSR